MRRFIGGLPKLGRDPAELFLIDGGKAQLSRAVSGSPKRFLDLAVNLQRQRR